MSALFGTGYCGHTPPVDNILTNINKRHKIQHKPMIKYVIVVVVVVVIIAAVAAAEVVVVLAVVVAAVLLSLLSLFLLPLVVNPNAALN